MGDYFAKEKILTLSSVNEKESIILNGSILYSRIDHERIERIFDSCESRDRRASRENQPEGLVRSVRARA